MSDDKHPHQPDENERLKEGTLPRDPREGAKKVKGEEAARVLTVRQILQASVERAEQAKNRAFCTTGHWQIDGATGGMMPGDCWLMGADTSVGKSSWAIFLADINIKRDKRVLIVSSEDDEALYGDRLMCLRSGVHAQKYRDGDLTDEDWASIRATRDRGEPIPVYCDARENTIEGLEPHLDKIIKEQAIDLIVFDYLQEFRSKRRWQDERIKYKEIAAVMRRIVKRNKKCGLITSQLTMTPNTKTPNKHNIRETRDVSNAAETILIFYIPEQDVKVVGQDSKGNETETDEVLFHKGDRVALVDKCKRGPRGGKFLLDWNTDTASFKISRDPKEIEQERIDRTYGNEADPDDIGDFADDG